MLLRKNFRVELRGVYSGEFLWAVSAVGYKTEYGTDQDVPLNDDGEYVIKAVLEEGWAERLLFRSGQPFGKDTLRVIAGAEPPQVLRAGEWMDFGAELQGGSIYCILNERIPLKLDLGGGWGGYQTMSSSSADDP